jgi:hypothetical protein
MEKKRLYRIVALCALPVLVTLVMTSCFPGVYAFERGKPAGFLLGIWHGWIAPLSLIVGIFRPDVHLYETFNTGWWYDFGFYIAVISGFGGLSLARHKDKGKRSR